jgi:hypothetical protein
LNEFDGKLVSLIVNLREYKVQLVKEKEFEEFMKLKRKKLEVSFL